MTVTFLQMHQLVVVLGVAGQQHLKVGYRAMRGQTELIKIFVMVFCLNIMNQRIYISALQINRLFKIKGKYEDLEALQ